MQINSQIKTTNELIAVQYVQILSTNFMLLHHEMRAQRLSTFRQFYSHINFNPVNERVMK